jgi:surface protein
MRNKSAFTFLNTNKGTISTDLQPQLIGAGPRTSNLKKAQLAWIQAQQAQAQQAQAQQAQAQQAQAQQAQAQIPPLDSVIISPQGGLKGGTPLPLVLVYKIHIPETKIQLPLSDIKGDLIIDWGDMSEDTAALVHTYNDIGLYTVIVSSSLDGTSIGRIGSDYSVTGIKYLIAIKSWGDFNIKSLKRAFASAKNLIKVPTDLPHGVTTLAGMFYDTDLFNQDISKWDVSNVTDMSCMFYCARKFNQPLNKWNIKNVITIDGIFIGASAFDQDISHWLIKCKFTNMG